MTKSTKKRSFDRTKNTRWKKMRNVNKMERNKKTKFWNQKYSLEKDDKMATKKTKWIEKKTKF